MKPPRPPKFVARTSYRRRRLIDAARLLPMLGLFLVLLPILWRTAETPEPDTAWGGIYLFASWFVLIVASFLLSRVLARAEPPASGTDPSSDPSEGRN